MRARRFHGANRVFSLPGGTEDNDLWVRVDLPRIICGDCGADRDLAELADATEPIPCPTCGHVVEVELADNETSAGALQTITSVWEPTTAERQAIAAGANIALRVWGSQVPVLLLATETPLGKGPDDAPPPTYVSG